VLLATLATTAGCGGASAVPTERATIHFDITPDTARVYTEDRFIGSARVLAAQPPSFRAGARQITISADGYFPVDLDLELAPGTTQVRVSMRAVPP
jgi:hypothetical protein